MQQELKINEHIAKFSGTANLPCPLKENHSYIVNAEFDLFNVSHKNRQDGTKDLIYCIKSTGVVKIKDEKEKIILAKKILTVSQKLRFAIEIYHNKHNGEPGYSFLNADTEVFYENTIKLINGNLDNIIRLVYTK